MMQFFSGWAACEYNEMKPAITAGTQTVAMEGHICADLASVPINHAIVGQGFGPIDVVSVMTWGVDPDATSAKIITTLGGVPNITVVVDPPTTPVEYTPVPTLNHWMLALLTLLLGAVALRTIQRRN